MALKPSFDLPGIGSPMLVCRAINQVVKLVQAMANDPIYKVIFFNQGQVYELYARNVYQSDLMGFLEVEEFIFGERSQVIVDPAE